MKVSGLLLVLIVLTGCAASSAAPSEPWRIEVNSHGGLAGRGDGSYAVTSDGNVKAKLFSGADCTFQLTATELRRVADLLARTKRSEWKSSYVPPNTCCDRIGYTAVVDEAGSVTTVKWIDEPLPMPADLAALRDAIISGPTSVRAMSADRCR